MTVEQLMDFITDKFLNDDDKSSEQLIEEFQEIQEEINMVIDALRDDVG